MTIDEAVRGLNALHEILKPDTDPRFLDAINLGVEALKRVVSQKKGIRFTFGKPLPGETKE